MSFDYAEMAEAAVEMLREAGKTGAVRRETPGDGPSYNPGEPTITDHVATMVKTTFRAYEIDGTRIKATDSKVLIAPDVEIAPTPADLLVLPDGSILSIVPPVQTIKPADVALLYIVQARSA